MINGFLKDINDFCIKAKTTENKTGIFAENCGS